MRIQKPITRDQWSPGFQNFFLWWAASSVGFAGERIQCSIKVTGVSGDLLTASYPSSSILTSNWFSFMSRFQFVVTIEGSVW